MYALGRNTGRSGRHSRARRGAAAKLPARERVRELAALEQRGRKAALRRGDRRLTDLRVPAAAGIARGGGGELAPLKLDSARFRTIARGSLMGKGPPGAANGSSRSLDQPRGAVRATDTIAAAASSPASSSPSRSPWPNAATPGR